MFTDWSEALEAESLPLDPTTPQQRAAATRATARRSHDHHDLTLLLDALALPTDPDTITTLLPLIPETGDHPVTTTPALSAFEAMALSMHTTGDSDQKIREATGLSDLIANHGTLRESTVPAAIDVPVIPLPVSNSVQELLGWAAAHPAAAVRNRATRITADLAELTERRDTEAAQREVEEKVARIKADPERAQEELRWFDADTDAVEVFTETGQWVGTAPDPDKIGVLLEAFEERQATGGE
ncbi:hypothetical protein ACFVAO_05940 [Streptomyces californicus]|uniref:hypothetical protein n=1 Tax=Streptomyces californicus TaxID=67351 RepID=UPI0036B89619